VVNSPDQGNDLPVPEDLFADVPYNFQLTATLQAALDPVYVVGQAKRPGTYGQLSPTLVTRVRRGGPRARLDAQLQLKRATSRRRFRPVRLILSGDKSKDAQLLRAM